MTDAIDRRLELRVLDMVGHTQARLGAGFGKYPLGAMDVLEHILPLCRRDDSAWPDIERGMNDLRTKMSQKAGVT